MNAKEFIEARKEKKYMGAQFPEFGYTQEQVEKIAIDFAKEHVTLALEAAYEEIEINWDCLVEKGKFMNSYPLENIR